MASIYEVRERVDKMARYSISRLHLSLRHCKGGGGYDGDGIYQLTLTSSKALTSPYPSSSKDKVHGLEGPSCWSESDLRIAYYQEQGVYGNGVLCRDSSNQ
jgi:hypothetical protein